MRLLTFEDADGPRAGYLDGDAVQPIDASVFEVIRGAAVRPTGPPVPLGGLRLLAPHRPGKLIGIGLNYRAHAAETGMPVPTAPLLFAKLPTAVTGPSGPVELPSYSTMVDFEGELAVVIGREARAVPVDRALDHVFGYAVMNDVSARDVQRTEPQWVRAKGGDTFAPWGPWITTADEVPDPQRLRVRTWVSGELMQDDTTAEMVFSVADLVAFISASLTLEPGDLIATGTPAGVGVARDPRRFLRPGDTVAVEIDGLGRIEHPVVAGR